MNAMTRSETMQWMNRSQLIFAAALLAGLILLLIWNTPACAQETLSARQVVDKATEMRRLDGSEAVSTLTIYNEKGQARERKLAMATKLFDDGKTEYKLSRFLEPADVKGTGFLTYDYEKKDDDMWMYLPSLRKTRRLVSSEKSKSFMGSEFAYTDLNIPNLDDFEYTMLPGETVDGVKCWVIEGKPKTEAIAEEHGYSKRQTWIRQTDYVMTKAVYYDLDGALMKEMKASEIKLIDPAKKRYRPMRMEMVNKQNNRRSVMVTNKIEFNPNVSDEYFSQRYLSRE